VVLITAVGVVIQFAVLHDSLLCAHSLRRSCVHIGWHSPVDYHGIVLGMQRILLELRCIQRIGMHSLLGGSVFDILICAMQVWLPQI